MLSVYRIINEPVPSNCFVVYDKAMGQDCMVIDPGTPDNRALFDYLEKECLQIKLIVLTHEHFDHCWGVNQILERQTIPILCSKLCAEFIKDEKKNCSVFYNNKSGFKITSETISIESNNNNVLRFYGTDFKFYMTPGHTNASICFTVNQYIFTGDTLIKNLRTVTKLPTGSIIGLQKSKDLLKGLQGNGYIVCPGHGDVFDLDGYDLELMFEGDLPR